MFFVPTKNAHHFWAEAIQTDSINNMRRERMKFLMFFHETDRITRFLFCFRHPNFHVHGAFLGCHVTFCLASTCCMVSTVLVVSSKRETMSSLATSCLVKSQHSRYSQGAAAIRMTWCGGAPQLGKCQWRARCVQLRTQPTQSILEPRNINLSTKMHE